MYEQKVNIIVGIDKSEGNNISKCANTKFVPIVLDDIATTIDI